MRAWKGPNSPSCRLHVNLVQTLVQHIQKRESGYYLRYPVPTHYRTILGIRELKYALQTHRLSSARRLVGGLVIKIETFLSKLAVQAPMADLTQYQIQQLVRTFVRECIQEFHHAHVSSGSPIGRDDIASRIQGLQFLESDVREAIGTADYSTVEGMAIESIESAGLTVDATSVSFRLLCAELQQAQRELLKTEISMLRGEHVEVPPRYREATSESHAGLVQAASVVSSGPKLSEVVEDFIKAKRAAGGQFSDSTAIGYRDVVNQAIFVLGDVCVDTLKYKDGEYFRDTSLRLPSNRNKKREYRGKSREQLLAMTIPAENLLTATTVRGQLGYLKRIFDWLKKRDVVRSQPFDVELKAVKKTGSPFTPPDLKKIFDSPLYRGDKPYSNKRGERAKWWLLPLALFTGARLGELVQLTTDDIEEIDGILILHIREDAEIGRTVKTAAGVRKVPIHPKLIELGFVEYLVMRKKGQPERNGRVMLLPNLPKTTGQNKRAGAKVSDWFSRYRDNYLRLEPIESEARNKGKSFHSFRHTAVTEALNQEMDSRHLKFVIGHSEGDAAKNSVTDDYDHGAWDARDYYKSICLLEYAGLNLGHLKNHWRTRPE